MKNHILRLELTTPEDEDLPVYLAGNFNDWNSNDKSYQLHKVDKGKYLFTFNDVNAFPLPIEYKYTRGSWETEELDKFGNSITNRRLNIQENKVKDFVPRWKKNGLYYNPDFLPEVQKSM